MSWMGWVGRGSEWTGEGMGQEGERVVYLSSTRVDQIPSHFLGYTSPFLFSDLLQQNGSRSKETHIGLRRPIGDRAVYLDLAHSALLSLHKSITEEILSTSAVIYIVTSQCKYMEGGLEPAPNKNEWATPCTVSLHLCIDWPHFMFA